MQVVWPLPWRVRLEYNLHETYQLPHVQLITPDDGQRSCSKHVEFRDKISFGYVMQSVGYLYKDFSSGPHLEFIQPSTQSVKLLSSEKETEEDAA